ncbi:hypothetical protein Q674_05110 [Acinetobacter sp. COS3]|jgi:hypothetical protein|uniref:hypothetical protein n=1 Tax=Acinetobacter TaxID=469 RepID=UPI000365C1C5|nr:MULTISPECIES: hypothetical protein [Acinetobacter]ERP96146.1 hypothetical protein Q674_05110 [Acinetobacter sp. COS3]MCR4529952.1 hypothetical protein [Acinetobacter venetianus]MDA0695386.1 hypothetical protein [Pseudomonadota bacterium]MDA1253594.1 hypothetical protein [Pseudomonadota bacterium]
MKVENLTAMIDVFKAQSEPIDRYTSFDYCYNYFKTTEDLTADLEKSCLVLGFYLASWGMLRGSSFLLQKSIKYFQPLIEYYAKLDKAVWEIDIDQYSNENIEQIMDIYDKTKGLIIADNRTHLTLVTKILLGVFGFIPAFDQYFCQTFRKLSNNKCGFRVVNPTSLALLNEFYLSNKLEIDEVSENTYTKDFKTGDKTDISYPKAKIVDMYGFTYRP